MLVISTLGNRLDQLDLLTHEDEELCGAGAGGGSVSAGAKSENKAQTELSNTPFHRWLSSLSATAAGENLTYPPWMGAPISRHPSLSDAAVFFSTCPTACAAWILSLH